ncbi:hypothetical protein BKA59DRAFT_146880 [Fusarium tricinctum]|uniref:Ankyrin repeat protein n=1 Tax=Fusarium tricinctum TaxID=61284 RepID=A0A8K0RXV0_9HYPO|nr:hypothetical protein BKA59DRAFT_146880 [Fusarium tricinctum]
MSTDPAGTPGTAVSNSSAIPNASTMPYGQNASLKKMPPEIFRMIANELGEREVNNGMYHSYGSLANFILALKPAKEVLEEYLYTEDLLCTDRGGLMKVLSADDELTLAVLSKYPEALLKLHIDFQFTWTIQDKPATWTLLHMAVALSLEKTIIKLHELGALYQDIVGFGPVLGDRFDQILKYHTRISHHPVFGHLQALRWKPGFVPFILGDKETYMLLARLWKRETYSVATYHFRYVITNKPADYPMTLQHLAVLGDDEISLDWTKYAARTYPWAVEAPGGETRASILHAALKANNKPVLKFLLKNGIGFGPHFVDTDGNNPFHTLINEGLKATNAKSRAEWRKLKNVFFNTVPQLEWNTLMVQAQHPRNSALQLAIEHIRYNWGASKGAIKEIINLILKQEMVLLKKWNMPPKSLLVNLPNADGDTPLSRLADIIDNREQAFSRAHWDLFDELIKKHGADINLDVNAIFTPRSYRHSIANQVHRRGRFVGHVCDSFGEEHRAEIDETYPVSTPTNMDTYGFHAHQLPPGNPLNLQMPFSWPLLPVPPMVSGVANTIVHRERAYNYAITGNPDHSPYFAHILYLHRPIAAAAEAAQNKQDETRA